MAHPVTPPQSSSSNRPFLEASPFSDYYTESSPSADCASTLVQVQLLRRLDSFKDQIAILEPSARNAQLLNAQLDTVEAALNAPETQSREATDLEDSGLFLSDDESDEDKQSFVVRRPFSTQLRAQAHDRQPWDSVVSSPASKTFEEAQFAELVSRVQQSRFELEKRFQEVKVRMKR